MFPGGRKRQKEDEKDCLKREIGEELPKLKLGRLRLWKEVKSRNRHSGRRMSDAIFIAKKTSGQLAIGDKHEIDRAIWRKPRGGVRLTPTSRYIRDKLSRSGDYSYYIQNLMVRKRGRPSRPSDSEAVANGVTKGAPVFGRCLASPGESRGPHA